MSQCPNCKANLSCGCQKRVATNGAQVCSNCVSSYNASLNIVPAITTHIPGRPGQTNPSNVKVGYTPLRKN